MNSTKIHACAEMAKVTISCCVLGFAKISTRQPENGVEAFSGCLLAYFAFAHRYCITCSNSILFIIRSITAQSG